VDVAVRAALPAVPQPRVGPADDEEARQVLHVDQEDAFAGQRLRARNALG
jgi:hypothetical protein